MKNFQYACVSLFPRSVQICVGAELWPLGYSAVVIVLLFHPLVYIVDLDRTRSQVTSWDTHAGTVREEYEGGRSYISCVSEILDGEDCEGNAKNDMGECRMVRFRFEVSRTAMVIVVKVSQQPRR